MSTVIWAAAIDSASLPRKPYFGLSLLYYITNWFVLSACKPGHRRQGRIERSFCSRRRNGIVDQLIWDGKPQDPGRRAMAPDGTLGRTAATMDSSGIVVGPPAGYKSFAQQSVQTPEQDQDDDNLARTASFTIRAGVAPKAHQGRKPDHRLTGGRTTTTH